MLLAVTKLNPKLNPKLKIISSRTEIALVECEIPITISFGLQG
jgi:hypothetical protein